MQKELERIDAEIKQWPKWKQECAELYMQGRRNEACTTVEEVQKYLEGNAINNGVDFR